MLWTEQFEIESAAQRSAPRICRATPSSDCSRAGAKTRDIRERLELVPRNPEKGCQASPGLLPHNLLKINDGDPKRVSRFCDVRSTPPSNFRFRRFVQNRRPERPDGAEGHCSATAIYPTMLSNRNRRNSLKTKGGHLGYPTIFRRLFLPGLTVFSAPPKMNRHLRQGTASYPERSRGAAVPKTQNNSRVSTPEVIAKRKCLKP